MCVRSAGSSLAGVQRRVWRMFCNAAARTSHATPPPAPPSPAVVVRAKVALKACDYMLFSLTDFPAKRSAGLDLRQHHHLIIFIYFLSYYFVLFSGCLNCQDISYKFHEYLSIKISCRDPDATSGPRSLWACRTRRAGCWSHHPSCPASPPMCTSNEERLLPTQDGTLDLPDARHGGKTLILRSYGRVAWPTHRVSFLWREALKKKR